MVSAGMLVFLPFFVFDRIATFTTIVRPHPLRTPLYMHAGNSNARAQCTEISIPKRDGHTYIPIN